MFATERQNEIYARLVQNGAVTTIGLAKEFNVSIETIRRDLLTLEKEARLTRVHGGAVTKSAMKPFLNLEVRNKEFELQKKVLAKVGVRYVEEDDIIIIDSGSTAIIFAEELKKMRSKLTVITHSLDVFNILREHKDFCAILCGGHYLQSENSFYGQITLQTLSNLHAKKAFVFPSAISLDSGICDYQSELIVIQKQILASADEIFVLADSSKFEKKALYKLTNTERTYKYVTDNELSVEIKELYKENGINIITGEDNE